MSVHVESKDLKPDLQYQHALTALDNIAGHIQGAPPFVQKAHQELRNAVIGARMGLTGTEVTITALSKDNDYPAKRYEQASKALADAEDRFRGVVPFLREAGGKIGQVLEGAAFPAAPTDPAQRAELLASMRDIVRGRPDELAKLAREPRFSGLAVSESGKDLLRGYGLSDREMNEAHNYVRNETLGWLLDNGSPEQRAAVARVADVNAELENLIAATYVDGDEMLASMRAKVGTIQRVVDEERSTAQKLDAVRRRLAEADRKAAGRA